MLISPILTGLLISCSDYELSGIPRDEVGLDPIIEVDPEVIDFGIVSSGETMDETFTVTNVGDADLELGEITLSSGDVFELEIDDELILAPGDSIEGWVRYTPSPEPGDDEGQIEIPSNDPERPEASVALRGGLDPDLPVAICGVNPNPVAALYETATWIGSASYDPEDRPLIYEWSLISAPPGSNPQMPSAPLTEPDRPQFLADVVGIYTAQLVVTNDEGTSSTPCTVDLEAVPATDLWVELFWQFSGDDMDLHVVRGNGNLRTNQDCYYANCRGNGLSWGPAGRPGDPRLDIDDIPGTGPENINIDAPEDILYQVWIHDHPSRRRTAANDVTVNVYLSGSLAWSDTRTITGEDHDEFFAVVDWAAQTVTAQ